MRLLLDTHIFLWYITGDLKKAAFRDAIGDPENETFLSVASFWEATVKYKLGKLPLPQSPELYIPEQRRLHEIEVLSVDEESVTKLIGLPAFHHDPLDRMLICQALANDLTIVTVDPQIKKYSVPTL